MTDSRIAEPADRAKHVMLVAVREQDADSNASALSERKNVSNEGRILSPLTNSWILFESWSCVAIEMEPPDWRATSLKASIRRGESETALFCTIVAGGCRNQKR